MWLGPLIPVLAAAMAGFIAWRHETRRLERRTYHEPRGWDTSEQEFRNRVLRDRRRRRLAVTVLSARAGSVAATAALQLVQLGSRLS